MNNESFSDSQISSNIVSYLSNQSKDGEENIFRMICYSIISVTVLNLIITYTFIKLYLKFKHSKSIDIAEKINLDKKENFVSFKRLMLGFLTLSIGGIFNFCVYKTDFYKNNEVIPPGTLVLNFLTVFFSLCFVLKRKKVLEFVVRKMAVVLDHISFPLPYQKHKIYPMN